jgi:hypothetical protein
VPIPSHQDGWRCCEIEVRLSGIRVCLGGISRAGVGARGRGRAGGAKDETEFAQALDNVRLGDGLGEYG